MSNLSKNVLDVLKNTNPVVVEMLEDKEKAKDLSRVLDTEGGKLLTDSMLRDIVSNIDVLCAGHKDMDRDTMVSYITSIETNLSFIRALYTGRQNESFIDDSLKRMAIEAGLGEEDSGP